MTGFIGPDGKDWGVRKGVLALVMTREGGTWAIMTAHIMDFPSPLPVASAVPPRP